MSKGTSLILIFWNFKASAINNLPSLASSTLELSFRWAFIAVFALEVTTISSQLGFGFTNLPVIISTVCPDFRRVESSTSLPFTVAFWAFLPILVCTA